MAVIKRMKYAELMVLAFLIWSVSSGAVISRANAIDGTVTVTVRLYDSEGNGLQGAGVDYALGSWEPFGTTGPDGSVSLDFPDTTTNLKIRLAYKGKSETKIQNVQTEPEFVFRTIRTTVKLLDSGDVGLSGGLVTYSAGSWWTVGTTDASGEIVSELLGNGSYLFRMSYAGASIDANQDIKVDPVIVFHTVNVAVRLENCEGDGLPGGVVSYAKGSWLVFGTTDGTGNVYKELLPTQYNFKVAYGHTSDEISEDVGVNPTILFKTGRVYCTDGSIEKVALGGTWVVFSHPAMDLLPGAYNSVFYDGSSQYITVEACHVTTIPSNQPPEADAGGPYAGSEGTPIIFDASGATDSDGDTLQYRWDFDDDGAWDTEYSDDPTAQHTWNDDFLGTVTVEVYDGTFTDTDTASVQVENVGPTITSITCPVDPTSITTEVAVSASFTDPGKEDTHTALWNWGDGESDAGTVTESCGSGSATGSHSYTEPGVYIISLAVTDKDGDADTMTCTECVVVYDPNGGFVTGGGWINSPAGAYAPDETLEGKATFGFVSKYQKGATVPTGNTEFIFHVAGFKFKSTSYQWLVVAGTKAQYKGEGTINGVGNYGFILTAEDGGKAGTDTFRIKIWDIATDTVVYDNGAQTPISGGSIVIHK
jgi:hypothetical protein